MVINENADPSILNATSKVQTGQESFELSFIQRIKMRLLGSVKVGDRKEEGWISNLPFYAFRCRTHGLQYGYLAGFAKLLICPECSH